MPNPQPLRIRLFDQRKKGRKVVGHWFIRPVLGSGGENWKLSFWHPHSTWGNRRREEGQGYEQAMYVFASTFYELGDYQYREYQATLAAADAAIARGGVRRGFRPGYLKQQRTLLINGWNHWKHCIEQDSRTYMGYAVECGWPEVPLPAFPWEMS